jgi:YVTN family beta-propeller protein
VSARYTRTAIALHWILAALVLGQLALGWSMIEIPENPPGEQAPWFNLHKSIGLTIGLLVFLRLGWRIAHPPPRLPDSLPRWQVLAAKANHALLYACLLVMPVSGYLGSSFTKYPIKFFGTTLAHWGWDAPPLKELCSQVHYVTVWIFMALIAIHIAAALRHLLVERDGVFLRMWPWRAIGCILLAAAACVAVSPAAAGLALVGNENAGTISLIDTDKDAVVGEIRTGGKPRGTAIHAARRLAYVSDQPNNALLVIDIDKRAVTGKIDLGESPEGVYISPDGKLVAAAVELTNSVVFIDTAAGAVAFRVKIKGENPEHAVFSPDGRFVYVSAEEDDKLEVIDVAARELVAQLKVGTRPRGIAFTPDGAKAYVACERADTVYVLDARAHKILRTIKAGLRSNGLAMHPDGKRLYLSNGGDSNVMVIDTAADRVTATIAVGRRPWNMALTRDGAKLYVANGRSNSVSVIDTARNVIVRDIAVGDTPWGVHILD